MINTTTAGSQSAPVITALDDGRSLVVWFANAGHDDATMLVRGQFLNADGSLLGSESLLGTSPVEGSNARDMPPLTAEKLSDGNVYVAWSTNDSVAVDGDGSAVVGVLVDVNSGTAGAESLINTTTATNQSGPVVTALTAGGAFVVWYNNAGADGTGSTLLYGQYLNADGSKNGGEIPLGITSVEGHNGIELLPVTAIELSNGNLLIGWQGEGVFAPDGSSTAALGLIVDSIT
ncbi:MAG: hypothetical protein L3J04_01635, partial [Robiginitomaculum sp.]|nr:hypothetical protein [Robiginitomaculum sp.]